MTITDGSGFITSMLGLMLWFKCDFSISFEPDSIIDFKYVSSIYILYVEDGFFDAI